MKKRLLTGLKATSEQLHIGNYFGAVKPMIELIATGEYQAFMFMPDMHSFTEFHEGGKIAQYSKNIIKTYLASGLNPDDAYIYFQSSLPEHAQLFWVLACITHMGFMQRMHAYKDALAKGTAEQLSVGSFNYPILMAADIILYDADVVPVGKDQKQHVEFARDIAAKFNNMFGDTFKLPDAYIRPEVATVPGIDGRKMSKSYNNYIGVMDDPQTILKKIKQIPTDTKTVEEPKNPDECNVYNILKLFLTVQEDQDIRDRYEAGGLAYKVVKDMLYEHITTYFAPIQARYSQISDEELEAILSKHYDSVKQIASAKIQDVYKKVGFRYVN